MVSTAGTLKHRLYIFGLLFLSFGCSGNSGSSEDLTLPIVEVRCNEAMATKCSTSQSGKTVYLGVTSQWGQSCGLFIQNQTGGNFYRAFQASTNMNLSISSGVLYQQGNTWIDDSGSAVTKLINTSYRLCGFIDTTPNQQLDVGEPILEMDMSFQTSQVTADQWSDFSN